MKAAFHRSKRRSYCRRIFAGNNFSLFSPPFLASMIVFFVGSIFYILLEKDLNKIGNAIFEMVIEIFSSVFTLICDRFPTNGVILLREIFLKFDWLSKNQVSLAFEKFSVV